MRKYWIVAGLAFLIATLFIGMQSVSSGQYDWPMPGYDPPYTSFSPSTAPNTNATAWITALPGGTVWAYPVVAEGKVFIGAGGYLNAFDENTGSPVWRFSASGQPGYPCETVVGNGTVFFGTKEPGPGGYIYALNVTTGEELWRFATEGYLQANPAIVGDRLYFGGYLGSSQGKIYCINATTGASLWNFTTQDRPTTIAVAYEKVYVSCGHWETSTKAAIYCLNMYYGNEVWSKGTDRDIGSSLSVVNGKVYWSASDEATNQIFYALNATNGNEVWSTTRYLNSGGGRTAVAYGKVFFGASAAASGVYAMNETNGDQIWAFPLSTPGVYGGPAVADGKVFIVEASPSHMVYALNQTDGSLVWKYELQGAVHSQTSAIANGRVFVADHYDPKLYAFGPQYTGAQSDLTITTTTGGTTTPSPGTYSYTNGTVVSVRATPDAGYILNHWELDGSDVGSQNPITVTMDANHTLHATFAWLGICNLTITTTSGGTTSPTPGTYTYTKGTIVAISASPYANYKFDHWELDGSNVGSANPISVTMNTNHALQAFFEYVPPPVVGGVVSPIDKLGLLAPYIGLASTITVATVATIYIKRIKPRKEKQ